MGKRWIPSLFSMFTLAGRELIWGWAAIHASANSGLLISTHRSNVEMGVVHILAKPSLRMIQARLIHPTKNHYFFSTIGKTLEPRSKSSLPSEKNEESLD